MIAIIKAPARVNVKQLKRELLLANIERELYSQGHYTTELFMTVEHTPEMFDPKISITAEIGSFKATVNPHPINDMGRPEWIAHLLLIDLKRNGYTGR